MSKYNNQNHNASLLRRWLANRMVGFRSYISMLPDSTATVDRLRGPDGEKRVARIIEFTMQELGYENATPVESANSTIRRAVAGILGAAKGD